ncbi:MAG: D-ribose pyranase [Limisphaerales bacterium]
MKKDGILNQDLLKVIGSLGHTDRIVVCDVGLPIDKNVERIDLAVTKGVVSFMDVLKPLLNELVVEKIILAREIVTKSPAMHQEIITLTKGIPVEWVDHEEFKKLTRAARAIIRTGECTPYTNIILQSGVNF